MRDVAALAGVSPKTVSRVVNGEPRVTTGVRTRVLRAAEQLDYRHNLAASNLRRGDGRTGVVGAVLQDVSNSFSASLLRALENAARPRGTAIVAASLDEEPARERDLVRQLVTRRVDGLVLMAATECQDYLAAELAAGLPTVFVDRHPQGVDADSVTVDNVAGAHEATTHLARQGHRRIALLADLRTIATARDRIAGYQAAMRDAGLPFEPALVRTDLRTPEQARAAVSDLISCADPPTAIFTSRNTLSIAALRVLRSAGLSRSVALVGFDDFPLADLVEPPLTVVRQDVANIGRTAAGLLFARIDGDTSPPRHVVVPHALMVRGSGEVAPALR
jgi:LacI family transcriptional regulator